MNDKTIKIKKAYSKLFSSQLPLANSPNKNKNGIIYTLYSDKLNLLKLGFAYDNSVLEKKLNENEFILLDRKNGNKEELNLIIKTLNELDIKFLGKLSLQYSNNLVRYLSILGWPIGRSIYKQRKIKKEISYA